MNQKIFALSTAAALILGANVAMAATPVPLSSSSLPLLKKQFSLYQHGLSTPVAKDSLAMVRTHVDFKKVSHQRMQQMYQGVPVVGGYAIVHEKKGVGFAASKATKVTGKVYQDIQHDLGDAPQKSKIDQVLTKQLSAYKDHTISEKKAELVVYVDKKNQAHWAVKTSFKAENGKAIPKRPTAIVDVETLNSFIAWDNIKTERQTAYAKGSGGNERTGEYFYGDENGYPALEITRDGESQTCYLETDEVKIVDMGGEYWSENEPMAFACNEEVAPNTYMTGYEADGYDIINGAYSPTNDSMYGGYVIKHMYKDWYGLEALTNYDGSPMQLVMRVHYGQYYENAYWDGSQMTFGDGGGWMYPLVSMGVGAHEVSHGFTEQHADLQYYGQSGGMNESFSDMAAQAAEYYSIGEPSWKIGARIMKEESGYDALRYMDQPSKDGTSIDSADDYYSGLDVHYSSGVYNRLFYLMATSEGWNARKAFDVMVKANQDYWSPYADFETGACGIVSATNDYGYDVDQVKAALETVAISVSGCE